MDVCATSSETAPEAARRRYGRNSMISVKEVVFGSRDGVFDELFNAASIAQRGLRGKSRQSLLKNRSKDTSNIVLGPQKRTWNTGCHVSHAPVRETNRDVVRGGRHGCDYRVADKTCHRFSCDSKKDHRGTGRDRGSALRAGGVSFSRDNRFKESRHPIDEEPEWFSEGPTTVNETIELGRVLEIFEDDVDIHRKLVDRNHAISAAESKPVVNVSGTSPSKPDECATKHCLIGPASAPDPPESANICPPSETQGSRFKHLFNETAFAKKPGSVNDQLLQLLKGCNNITNVSSPEKDHVIQVENKLRSILLGHGPPRQSLNQAESLDRSCSKSQILTVEEIEAHLSLGSNVPPPTVVPPLNFSRDFVSDVTENLHTSATPSKTSQSISVLQSADDRSNLAPILQSLTSRQPPMPYALKPVQPISPNFFPTPITQLSSTSAVSANSRITQLQQTDCSASSLRDATHQGVLRQLWNTAHSYNSHNVPQVSNAFSQRSAGASPGYLPELGSRPGLGLVQPYIVPDTNRSVMPRRPIVKAQQCMIDRPIHPVVPMGSPCSLASPSLEDIDRRLLNLAFKQQPSGYDSSHFNSVFSTANNDLRFNAPSLPLFSNSISAPTASANTSVINSTTKIPPNRQNSGNTLAFLSQLMDMSDLTTSVESPRQPSFSMNLLGSGVKAKTLEEIEHQEVASGNLFF